MPDTPESLASRLESESAKSQEFFKNLTSEQWEMIIYSEGSGWTVRHVLAHFIASEIGNRRIVEDIVAGGAGSPDELDLNAYNEQRVTELNHLTVAEGIELFARERWMTVDLVGQMTPDDLKIRGRHPFFGETELAEVLKLIYRHNMIHQRDIRSRLSE